MSLSSVCVVLNALRLNLVNLNHNVKRKKHAVTLDTADILARLQDNKKAKAQSANSDNIDTQIATQDVCDNNKNDEGDINMTKTLKVEGMMCAHCVAHVKKALESIDGVQNADVSLDEKSAKVTLAQPIADEVLKAAVVDAGYEVTAIK